MKTHHKRAIQFCGRYASCCEIAFFDVFLFMTKRHIFCHSFLLLLGNACKAYFLAGENSSKFISITIWWTQLFPLQTLSRIWKAVLKAFHIFPAWRYDSHWSVERKIKVLDCIYRLKCVQNPLGHLFATWRSPLFWIFVNDTYLNVCSSTPHVLLWAQHQPTQAQSRSTSKYGIKKG